MNNLRVVFLSDWVVNPYKELLIKHLSLKGAIVNEYLWSTFFLFKVLRNGKVDILHLHTLHPFLLGKNIVTKILKLIIFVSQIAILRLLGTKTVWTVHEWSDKLSGGANNLSPSIAAVAVSFFSAVIVHCKTTKQELSKLLRLKSHRVLVIPHGNYISYYENQITDSEARKILNLNSDGLIFVLFGNIYRYKGVLEAIEAFKILNSDRTSLIIAGKVSESGLEAEIKKTIGTNKDITFIPKRIADDEVQIYLNAADCILLPYTVYTTSGIAILGMSFGKVCLAPEIGFFRDVIDRQGGFLYQLPHQKGLVTAMNRALDNWEQLDAMGAYNLNRMKKWNWDYVAKLTINAYKGDFREVEHE